MYKKYLIVAPLAIAIGLIVTHYKPTENKSQLEKLVEERAIVNEQMLQIEATERELQQAIQQECKKLELTCAVDHVPVVSKKVEQIVEVHGKVEVEAHEELEVEAHEELEEVSMWRNQDVNPLPPVYGNTPKKRFEAIIEYYGYNPLDFVAVRNKHWIPEELIAAIVWAETGFINFKSSNNIGNVGNNDRGDTTEYASIQEGLMAMGSTLNNKYLWNLETIGELSQGGRTVLWLKWCAEKWEYCYATSPESRNKNVLDFMSFIHGERINEDYKFRS